MWRLNSLYNWRQCLMLRVLRLIATHRRIKPSINVSILEILGPGIVVYFCVYFTLYALLWLVFEQTYWDFHENIVRGKFREVAFLQISVFECESSCYWKKKRFVSCASIFHSLKRMRMIIMIMNRIIVDKMLTAVMINVMVI